MGISVSNKQEESFLYVSGLSVTETIKLCENVEIIPACCDPSTDLIIKKVVVKLTWVLLLFFYVELVLK